MTREEALKQIREWDFLNDEEKAALETLIPELAESEDEKIRKDIINLIYWLKGNPSLCSQYYNDRYDDMLAYLEKQKEASKAIEAVERIDKYIDEHLANAHDMKDSNPDKKYYRGLDDALGKMAGILQDVYSEKENKFAPRVLPCSAAWFEDGGEKQKEQKHTLKFKVGDKVHLEGDEINILTITGIEEDRYLTDCAYGPILFGTEDIWERVEQKEPSKSSNMMHDYDFYFNEWIVKNPTATKRKCFEEGLIYSGRKAAESYNNGINQVLEMPELYGLVKKEQKPLSTEETELNSLAFLEQMGYTCIPPKKEHQNNSDAPKNALGGALNSPLDKDKNLDDIAQDYVEAVKEYNPEPTWNLMQTAVCYGYHYREQQEQKPAVPVLSCSAAWFEDGEQKPIFRVGDTMRTWDEAKRGIKDGLPHIISINSTDYLCNNEKIRISEQGDYEFPPMNRQKPAEWSEEEKMDIELLIALLRGKVNPAEIFDSRKESIVTFLKSLRSQPIQLKEAYKDGFQTARHATALAFMNYLDENRPEGKMSLSNAECEDIDKAFKEGDWAKIMRYYEKYGRRD